MEIFVFSYNRGNYLRNCLESLVRHAPELSVTVVDDGSVDPATKEVLEEYADTMTIVARDGADSDVSLGGLYANMNWVVRTSHADLGLFMQDDMQLVRDITADDQEHIARFFGSYKESIEFHTCFTKSTTKISVNDGLKLDSAVPAYFRDAGRTRRGWHSDVGVFHIARMRERGIDLRESETQNELYLQTVVSQMGLSPWPFMMWLPFPESVKFRRKGLLQRYAEWRAGSGLYPYNPMSTEQVRKLFARPLDEQPIAELYLTPAKPLPSDKWLYDNAAKYYRLPKKVLKWKRRRRGESKRQKREGRSANQR